MRVELFDFDLPEERIALRPAAPRDSARLLVVGPDGRTEDRIVRDLPALLRAGDVLVLPYAHPHEYVSLVPERPYRFHAVRLAFDPEAVPPLRPGVAPAPEPDPEADLAAFVRHQFREVRHLPGVQDAQVRELLSQLREEAQQQLPGYRFRVGALCASLVTLLARRLPGAGRCACVGRSPGMMARPCSPGTALRR